MNPEEEERWIDPPDQETYEIFFLHVRQAVMDQESDENDKFDKESEDDEE
uniref:Uncharacterized protein n=1 Tax=Solanum lycopersicum TaxID=4081 RepID=A0A3Q7GIS5_SOLLC